MRVNVKRNSNIIKLPNGHAKLIAIDPQGFYRYEVTYQVNVANAIMADAVTVNIEFRENVPTMENNSLFVAGNNPAALVNRIILQTQNSQTGAAEDSLTTFWSFTSDYTRSVDPGKVKRKPEVSTNNPQSPQLTYTTTRKVLVNNSVSKDRDSGRLKPIMMSNRHRDEVPLPNLNVEQEVAALRMDAWKKGVDLGTVFGINTYNIIPTESAVHGSVPLRKSKKDKRMAKGKQNRRQVLTPGLSTVNSAGTNSAMGSRKLSAYRQAGVSPNITEKMLLKRRKVFLRRELLNTDNPVSTSDLGPDSNYSDMIVVETPFETITETIDIPINAIRGNDFVIRATVINKTGFDIQKTQHKVEHTRMVTNLRLPRYAPTVQVLGKPQPGKTVLELGQKDENATSIEIYKKVVSMDEPSIDNGFKLLANVDLVPGPRKAYYTDNESTINPVIYRVMARNDDGYLSGEYDSAVVVCSDKAARKKTFLGRQSSYCAMTHRQVKDGIKVEVQRIPHGVTSFRIKRRDRTVNEKKYNNVGSPEQASANTDRYVITDRNLKKDRIYEYICILTYVGGYTETANNSMLVDYTVPEKKVLNLVTGQPQISRDEQGTDVKITLRKDILLAKGDIIKGFLIEQGLSEQYADEIYTARKDLQNLFFTRVVRQNLNTGEEEDFGTLQDNEFSDIKSGRARNIRPLDENGRYRYVFYTHARDAESLFDELVRTVEKTSVKLKTKTGAAYNPEAYSFSPAKWHHPVTLKQGNIVSDKSLVTNHAKSEFTHGDLVDITYVPLNLNKKLPTIVSSDTDILDDNANIVTWDVDGNPDRFDHFIIMIEISGVRNVVGKRHAVDQSGAYQFIDTLDNGETGAVKYIIVPVYDDLTFGPEEITKTIII